MKNMEIKIHIHGFHLSHTHTNQMQITL